MRYAGAWDFLASHSGKRGNKYADPASGSESGSEHRVPAFLKEINRSGKPLIYGGSGNGPAFIERTADIRQAVSDIIESKTFDYGMVSAAEQSIVVERCIEPEGKKGADPAGSVFYVRAGGSPAGARFCTIWTAR